MDSVAEVAYREAKKLGLDLSVTVGPIPVDAFMFRYMRPRSSTLQALKKAKREGLEWAQDMPIPVVTLHGKTFEIMDGMMRIRAAQEAGFKEIPAIIASGDTYDALRHILKRGYYGEDFVEMMAMESPVVRKNLEHRNKNRMAGA
jgi:hypothetical protein